MGSAAEFVDSRATLLSNLSEDIGELVGRNTMSESTNVRTHPLLVLDIAPRPRRGRNAEMRLQEREGTDLDGTISANIEIESPQPKVGASNADLKPSASSVPVEKQKEKRSFNAIDDLFQGLD